MQRMKKKTFGAALIVAGTSIGAGMLALPVATSAGGFFPALFVYVVCWALMTISGLFILEIALKMPEGSNLVSMARKYLGAPGQILSWILYLFLFYSLSTAYISLGGALLADWMQSSSLVGSWLFLVFFGGIVFLGASFVDKLNELLMLGLFVSYAGFLFLGWSSVHPSYLLRSDIVAALPALPIIFTAFSYQGTVPSLTTYLNRDKKELKKAIVLGTSLVFVVYVIWQALILGIIPYEGDAGLQQAKKLGESAVQPLRYQNVPGPIYLIGECFSFFAIATSFLGVTMGLFDFLADGLHVRKTLLGKIFLGFVTFLPSAFIAMSNPSIFFAALDYAGGFGCSTLLVLFPTLMILVSRYSMQEQDSGMVILSKSLLVALLLLVSLGILYQIFHVIARFF